MRRQLGYQGPGPSWQDADKIAVDANYMAVDIVINWAADGVVLCFIHAVVDLTPRDNDEHNKTGWTNWCGTPYMSMEQVDFLHQRLRQREGGFVRGDFALCPPLCRCVVVLTLGLGR